MRKIILLITIILSGAFFSLSAQELKAFPTAEGFGKLATGGRGGKVVTVTTLADDSLGTTVGSFRWAMDQHASDFTIVFAVSGKIELVKDLRIKKKNFTIAGQTAPGEGIYFCKNALNFGGSENFIIRHIRCRVGNKDYGDNFTDANALNIENAKNFIIDHCSFGWSAEENMTTYDNLFQTVQWCIVHEGLYDAGHGKGVRSYACQWGGAQATYHHNLLAHCQSRSPRFNGAQSNDRQVFLEFINNVDYNWGSSGACYGGENTGGSRSIHELNMINNYYKPGPASPTSESNLYFVRPSYARSGMTSNGPSQWHLSGNIMEGSEAKTNNNSAGIRMDDAGNHYTLEQMFVDTIIIPDDEVRLKNYKTEYHTYTYKDYETAEEAYNSVLALNAGAGAWPHDIIDRRILEEAFNKTSTYGNNGIINTPEDAGGFPEYSSDYTAVIDNDGDGIDDEWERTHGLNPADPNDGNFVNSIGYTALEAYLNDLVGESVEDYNFQNPTGIHLYESGNGVVELIENSVTEQLLIKSTEDLSFGSIYNMNGVKMMNIDFSNNSNSIHVAHLSRGHYLLTAFTTNGQNKTARFVKK